MPAETPRDEKPVPRVTSTVVTGPLPAYALVLLPRIRG
jgi:hypothetical protein